MIPVLIYEALSNDEKLQTLGINSESIFELQSVDERPNKDCFLIANWQESFPTFFGSQNNEVNAPRTLILWVHQPWDITRSFNKIDSVLNAIDNVLMGLEQQLGSDNIRVSCINKQGRSGNLVDDAWKTIARNATYRVLYDEKSI